MEPPAPPSSEGPEELRRRRRGTRGRGARAEVAEATPELLPLRVDPACLLSPGLRAGQPPETPAADLLALAAQLLLRLDGIWFDGSGDVYVVTAPAAEGPSLVRTVVHVRASGQVQVWAAALHLEPSNFCIYSCKDGSCSHVALLGDGTFLQWLPLTAAQRPCRWQRLPGTAVPPPPAYAPAPCPFAGAPAEAAAPGRTYYGAVGPCAWTRPPPAAARANGDG